MLGDTGSGSSGTPEALWRDRSRREPLCLRAPPLPSPPSRPRSPHRAAGSGSRRCRGCAWGPPRGSPWPGSNREGAVRAVPGPLSASSRSRSRSRSHPQPPLQRRLPAPRLPVEGRHGGGGERLATDASRAPLAPSAALIGSLPSSVEDPLSLWSVWARGVLARPRLSLWSVWAGCVRRPLAASGAGRMRKWWWRQ